MAAKKFLDFNFVDFPIQKKVIIFAHTYCLWSSALRKVGNLFAYSARLVLQDNRNYNLDPKKKIIFAPKERMSRVRKQNYFVAIDSWKIFFKKYLAEAFSSTQQQQ